MLGTDTRRSKDVDAFDDNTFLEDNCKESCFFQKKLKLDFFRYFSDKESDIVVDNADFPGI